MEINTCAIIALDLLKLIKKYGWEVKKKGHSYQISKIEWWCIEEISNYLSDIGLGPVGATSFISSMIGNIPEWSAQQILKRGFNETRHWKRCYACKKCNEDRSLFALIPCGHMFCSSCPETFEASECPRCNTAFTSTLKLK